MTERLYNLAIETSSSAGSVTLGRGDEMLQTLRLDQGRRHNVELMPAVERLLKAEGAGPSALGEAYVSIGPGSFTGLRVAVATAKMLAEALGAKVVAVPTLSVVAQNAPRPPEEAGGRLAVCLALKSNTLYTATFRWEEGGWVMQGEPRLLSLKEVVEQSPRPLALVGDPLPAMEALPEGVRLLPRELAVPRSEAVWKLGRQAAARGEFADPQRLIPLYVRPPEAEELWAKRKASRR